MQLISPEQSIAQVQKRLPNNGRHFLLCDALEAMQDFYGNVRVSHCDDDGDTVVAVAGKFGDPADRRVEIGLYRSFGLMRRLEISLRYPVSLRCLFLKTAIELCESPEDANRYFHTLRSVRWFRRYASTPPTDCVVRWRGEEEMAEMYREIVPKILDALGPTLGVPDPQSGNSERLPEESLRRVDREFADNLGPEDTTRQCHRNGCERGAVKLSVFCRRHHFEMITRRPYPFDE